MRSTTWLPESALQLVIGTLLLIFGLQWLRKAILRSSGRKAVHDEDAIYRDEVEAAAGGRQDQQGRAGHVRLHGLLQGRLPRRHGGRLHRALPSASTPTTSPPPAVAAAAVVIVLIVAIALSRPLSMINENLLKYGVGLLLVVVRNVLGGGGHRNLPRRPGEHRVAG